MGRGSGSQGARRWRGAGLLAALVAAGCLASLVRGPDAPRFTHGAHLGRDLACADCHEGAEKAAKAGMPAPERCDECHEPKDAAQDRGRPAIDAYAARPETARYLRPASTADVRFDHAKHAARKIACVRCHAGAETEAAATPGGAVRMEACLECHRERGGEAPERCAGCHERLKTTTPPRSHGGDWTHLHGTVVRMGPGERTDERCDLCHTRSSCAQCHAATRPRDHTNDFMVVTHGLRAAIDRDRCAACHRMDSCDRCHQNRPPRSHVASFGGAQNRHCNACHLPLGDQGCVACHKATSSHLRAPPLPPGGVHLSAASPGECLSCHRRIPHPDGGFDCRACHR